MWTFFQPVRLTLAFPIEDLAHDGLQCAPRATVRDRRLVKVDGWQGGIIVVDVH